MKHLKSRVSSLHAYDVTGVPNIRTIRGMSYRPERIDIALIGSELAGFTVTTRRNVATGDEAPVRQFNAASLVFRRSRPLWLSAAIHAAQTEAKERGWG
jgi:hypothetical protein